MPNQLFFLQMVIRDFLEPLRRSLASRDALEYLFYRYGWDLSLEEAVFDLIRQEANLQAPLDDFLQQADALRELASGGAAGAPTAEQLTALAASAQRILRAIAGFELSDLGSLPEPLGRASFWTDIGSHLLDDLLDEYLRVHYAKGYLFLHLFGVIRYEAVEPAEARRRPYTRVVVDWEQAVEVVKDPLNAFKQTYRWGDPAHAFEHRRLFAALEKVLRAARVSARLASADTRTLASIASGATYAVATDEDGLWVQLLYEISPRGTAVYDFGVEALPARRLPHGEASGLLIRPVLRGGGETELNLAPNLNLKWSVAADAGEVLAVVLFPDRLEWVAGPVTVGAAVELTSRSDSPRYLVGNADTARIEVSDVSLGLAIEGGAASPEIKLQLKTGGRDGQPACKAVIPLGEADGFVTSVADREAIEFPFSAELTWSNKSGLKFNGGSTADVTIPLRVRLGSLMLQDAHLALRERAAQAGASALELRMGTGLQGQLGPVHFAVSEIGFSLTAIRYSDAELRALPPEQAPLFGRLDLQLEFAPPAGAGIRIDSGVVTGGGFLSFNPASGLYAGTVQLDINGVALQAVGLITTRMPDGSRGFSLLVILTVADFAPINLGFGFRLTAVGGLLGLNRTADVEALRAGLKSGSLDAVLFPRNPVADAPRLVTTLQTVMPPRRGQFLAGPVGRITWGVPTILTIELGIVLEFPSPTRLLVLGQFRALLPSADRVLVRLQMDALGVVNFDRSELAIDAVLYDSRILTHALTGEMALRARWSGDPVFLLAVGGFHPKFAPPAGFPRLERTALTLSKGDRARLRLEAYFALTSNTAQVGARVELLVRASGFSVEGHLGFDALFRFSPFHFTVDIEAGVTLKWHGRTLLGVTLELTLSGPSPWHARGKAIFKIWRFSKSVSFDRSFGADQPPPALPAADPLPELLQALADVRNWSAELPAASSTLLTVRAPTSASEPLVHPLGELSVRQRVVPLGITIDRFGNTTPAGDRRFSIEPLSLDGQRPASVTPVLDFFAPAQFLEMSDADKLRRPSFERMEAGVQIGGALSFGGQDDPALLGEAALEYETVIPGVQEDVRTVTALELTPAELGAIAALDGHRPPMQRSGRAKYRAPGHPVALAEARYVIASTRDLAPVALPELEDGAPSYTAAAQALWRHLEQRPALRGELQVVTTLVVEGVGS